MTQIKELLRSLEELPGVTLELSEPADPASGTWFVNVSIKDRHFVLEFTPGVGFGLSEMIREETGYGERPDKVYPTYEEAVSRLVFLLEPWDDYLRSRREGK
jgi:hypothetical protein